MLHYVKTTDVGLVAGCRLLHVDDDRMDTRFPRWLRLLLKLAATARDAGPPPPHPGPGPRRPGYDPPHHLERRRSRKGDDLVKRPLPKVRLPLLHDCHWLWSAPELKLMFTLRPAPRLRKGRCDSGPAWRADVLDTRGLPRGGPHQGHESRVSGSDPSLMK